jgi:WD40 repeat protein
MKSSLASLIILLLSLASFAQTKNVDTNIASETKKDTIAITKIRLQDHTDYVEQVAFSPAGDYFASAGWDESVMIYHTDSAFNYHSHFFPHNGNITALNFSRDSRYLVTGGQDRKMTIWEFDSSFQKYQLKDELMLHGGSVTSALFDPAIRFIFSASDDGGISIYDMQKKNERRIKNGVAVNCLALSLDRRNLFVADNSALIKQYNAIKGQQIKTFEGHTDYVNSLALSLDRKYMVSGSNDKTAIIWNLQTGKVHKKLLGHSWKVTSVDISTDSKYVITGSTDGTVKLWDMSTGNLLRTFEDGGRNVRDVAFNRDGTLLATGLQGEGEEGYYGAVIWTSGLSKPVPVRRGRKRTSVRQTTTQSPSKPAPVSKNRKTIKKTEEMEISIEDK